MNAQILELHSKRSELKGPDLFSVEEMKLLGQTIKLIKENRK